MSARFDAALARAEEDAASDLAYGLRQDRRLVEVLCRAGSLSLHLPGGARREVSVVGDDYVASGNPVELIIPIERVVASAAGRGRAVKRRGLGLISALREWARAGAIVEVATASGSVRGPLLRVGPDYLGIGSGEGERLVARSALEGVRRVSGKTTDAL